jgi:uncharacterized protein YggT (Ycf19 family)
MNLDTAFNLLLFLFWFRAWTERRAHTLYNPYLVRMDRLSTKLVNFVRPVFGQVPPWAVAALALLALILLRGVVCLRTPGALTLQLGFTIGAPNTSNILSCTVFSLLSFAIFLFQCWGLTLIFLMLNPSVRGESPTGFLADISRPFSSLPPAVLPPALLALGTLLAWVLTLANAVPAHALPLDHAASASELAPTFFALRLGVCALAGWVQLLNVLQTAMLWSIIGSLIGAFSGNVQFAWFCQDWINSMLGPLRRYPIRLGMFDLTPLIFFLAIRHLVYPFFMRTLHKAYMVLT